MTDRALHRREMRISLVRLTTTDLIVAISDDLKGLLVPGRSQEEIRSKLNIAITELLEAEGHDVFSVSASDDDGGLPEHFEHQRLLATAELCI